jgi:zinc protease
MLNRSVAPPFTRSIDFELIQPRTHVLPNGLKMFIVSGGSQEVVRVEILLRAGRWFETTWGAAYFAANLMSKGTSTKSSYEIAQYFDQYGAHFEVGAGLDVVSLSLYTLTKNLEPTLALVRELLQDSTFPEKELTQLKSIYIQNLRVNQEKTSFQAGKLIRRNLFGEAHPYGKELEEKEVEALTREQLVQHMQAFGKDMVVFASGRVTDAAEKIIRETLSTLTVSPGTSPAIEPFHALPSHQYQKKEGSTQASIRMGRKSIGRSHPDYAPVLLINHILGGYFGSRLMKNIREDKGLSYGIYSSLHTLKQENYLVIGADVNNENLELTFAEIRKELGRLYTEPVGGEELEMARNHFIGSLQSEITTPFAHAEKIKNIFLYNLPADYYQNLIRTLDGLTADQLMQIARSYFEEDSFFEVAVG